MIQSKEDYKEYIEADRVANHISKRYKGLILSRLRGGYVFLYLSYMRRIEYIENCKNGLFWKIVRRLLYQRLYHWSAFTGITIPPNTFGKGLYIPHWGSIVVNGNSHFGDNCVVQNGVNVSEEVKGGNHIYLGAGCKLLIGAEIGNDVIVAANAVVNKCFKENNIVLGGIPAKIISEKGFLNRKKI